MHVAVNDVINYQIKIHAPATVSDVIKVYDKPSKGLKYNIGSLVVKCGDITLVKTGENPDYTLDQEAETGWTATINSDKESVQNKIKGKDVVFTFTMTVTEEAFKDTEKENTAELEYGSGSIYNPPEIIVPYDIYFGGIYKFDGESKELLSGTEFTLTLDGKAFNVSPRDGGKYYVPDPSGTNVLLTNASGTIVIRGIDADKTYVFTETAALPGYNPVETPYELESGSKFFYLDDESGTTPFSIKITANPSGTWQPVENNKGSLLPSTGGIGTTIFYVVGAVLVIGTGVVLVTRRRMGNAD